MTRTEIRINLTVTAIVVLALAVRLWRFDTQSLWLDEAASWMEANGSFAEVIAATLHENFPPLHNIILWLSISAFGDAEWALRLPSVLLGTATVWLVYRIGARLEDWRVGVLAALLLALAPFHIWHSQEARMYALLAFTAALFAATALGWLARPSRGRLAGMALAGAALLYSHVFGLAAWLGILVGLVPYLRRQRGAFAGVALGAVISGLLFAPWMVASMWARIGTIAADGFWIGPATLRSVSTALMQLAGGIVPSLFLLVLVGIAVLARGVLRPSIWFAACWFAASIVVDLAVSLLVVPLFISRYLIASLPALMLLAAMGAVALAERWRYALPALAVLVVVAGVLGKPPADREQWREVAAWLGARVAAGDCVLVVAYYAAVPLDYYLRGSLPCVVPVPRPEAAASVLPASPATVYVVVSHAKGADRQVFAALAPRYLPDETATFRGIAVHRLGLSG